jgi:hypothetical protein
MTIEADIFMKLQSLVSGHCYTSTFPQAPATPVFPAIRYTRVSAAPGEDLLGDGGDETADVRMQLDLVAKSFGAMTTLRDQVMVAMKNFDPPAVWDSEFRDYDFETKTHRCVLDYLFYPSSVDI